MLLRMMADPRFFAILFRIDRELAESVRADGCACGGTLHVANYPRKPRFLAELRPEHERRLSFCCASCRGRTTPPSVRFLGRRVFAAPLFLVASALADGRSSAQRRRLSSVLGIDRRTLERWRAWWRDEFSTSRFWHAQRAHFMPPVDPKSPSALLSRFHTGAEGLLDFLRFLSPLSVRNHAP